MKKKLKINLHPLGKQLTVNENTSLIDVLHDFGVEFPCAGKGTCGNCKVKLLSGNIELSEIHKQKIEELELEDHWRLACMSSCTDDITLEVDQFAHIILADESEFEFIANKGFGVAVDLGTTTVVAQLVNLQNGEVIAVESILNPQVKYGADLIARVQASINGHLGVMTTLVRRSIGSMIESMLEKHPVELKKVVIVGNTVMQLIFSGCDLSPLATYPFHIDDLDAKIFEPGDLGWRFNTSNKVEFYPSIGSFVGSDILAGIVATGLHRKDKYTALIDLGTNGEIVVGNKHKIVCASTAAGPAFEGANISIGMRATTGAISGLRRIEGKIKAEVIGNSKPKGICGSALIDAIDLLHKQGLIGMFGEITSGEAFVPIVGELVLTQKDIQEFLLAKAAISAGLSILSTRLSISPDELETVYIAGGFGNYMKIENIVSTGMLELDGEKIHKMGNTALIGAKVLLFENANLANSILERTQHINLEGDPHFQDIYVNKMLLNSSAQ